MKMALQVTEKRAPIPTHDIGVAIPANTKYLSRNPVARHLIRRFMRALIELAGNIKPHTALDVGCGEGLVIRQQRDLWPDAEIHGADVDSELLQVARRVAPRAGYIAGSIYRLPFPTGAYDVVICTEVLEHLDRPDAALAECARVAREYCLLSVPSEPWWRAMNMLRARYVTDWGNTPGHVNHWSRRGFVEFARTWLEIIDTRHPFPWTLIIGAVRH